MEVFPLILNQMLMMFTLMAVGFILRRLHAIPDNAGSTLSKLETFVLTPTLLLNNQLNKCNLSNFTENAPLMLYGLGLIVLAIVIAYPLSLLFVSRKSKEPGADYKRNVYKYSIAFANFGFAGNYIVTNIFGDDMFFKYSLFTFFLTLLCYAWGLFILIPKDAAKKSIFSGLKKGLLTPPMIAMLTGIIGGLLGVKNYLPDFFMRALSDASKCYGPIAMFVAGIIIGGFNLKKLFGKKKVYFLSALRLIVIPTLFVLLLKLLHADEQIITFAIIAFSVPLGLNTIVYPATYGGDTEEGASMVLISNVLCVITLPIMYTLLTSFI